jgi:hypothetical protein
MEGTVPGVFMEPFKANRVERIHAMNLMETVRALFRNALSVDNGTVGPAFQSLGHDALGQAGRQGVGH